MQHCSCFAKRHSIVFNSPAETLIPLHTLKQLRFQVFLAAYDGCVIALHLDTAAWNRDINKVGVYLCFSCIIPCKGAFCFYSFIPNVGSQLTSSRWLSRQASRRLLPGVMCQLCQCGSCLAVCSSRWLPIIS